MPGTILLIGNHPPPYGGVPTHIKYLAPYLVERGWQVHILNFTGNRQWGRVRSEYLDGYWIHRPTTLLLWIHLLLPGSYLVALKRLGSMFFKRPKLSLRTMGMANVARRIIASHGVSAISAYHLQAGLAGAIAGESASVPLVTTIFGELFSESRLFRSIEAQVRYVCARSLKLLSCSRHCAESFRAVGMEEKAEAVHYGIDIAAFNPGNDGAVIRSRLGIPGSDIVVAYVGRMVEEMGLGVLLESITPTVEKQPRIRFLVAGRSGPLTETARELAQRFPGNLHVVADVPFGELPQCYGAADAVIVPSINERACLGLAIAEALATGKPVIVSNVGGGPEVMDEETGILVPPGDPKALSEAILGMISDPVRMGEMGRKGRQKMITLFDKDETNAKMEAIFQNMLP